MKKRWIKELDTYILKLVVGMVQLIRKTRTKEAIQIWNMTMLTNQKALKILNLRREYIEEKKQPEKHGEKAQIILPQFTEKKVDWKASTNLNEFHNLMDEEVRGWLY